MNVEDIRSVRDTLRKISRDLLSIAGRNPEVPTLTCKRAVVRVAARMVEMAAKQLEEAC